MKQQSKLTSEQQQDVAQHTTEVPGREFASPDELIRFDASQTTVPKRVDDRVREFISTERPPPSAERAAAWWRRIFGGNT